MKNHFFFLILFCFTSLSLTSSVKMDTTFYYPNGSIASEGKMVNNRPDGYWKTYHKNGALRSEGNRVDYKLDGLWVFYDTLGRREKEIMYKTGLKEGDEVHYKDGVVEKKIPYVKNIRQGISYSYYPSGKIYRRDTYANDQILGESMIYDTTGVVISLITHRDGVAEKIRRVNRYDSSGHKSGQWVWFYDDTPYIEHQGVYSRGKRHGIFKYYDKNGNLLRSEKYIDDMLEEKAAETSAIEVRRTYYDNGKLKSYESMRANTRDGLSIYYDMEGNIDSVSIYKDDRIQEKGHKLTPEGLKEGRWYSYSIDGNKSSQGEYKAGNKVGEWIYYYADGNIESVGNYVNGHREGEWLWYYADGSLLKKENYIYGKREGQSVEYDVQGKILSQGNYEYDNRNGNWFFINGTTIDSGSYLDGKKEGIWSSKDIDSGKIVFKCMYRDGSKNGEVNFYYVDGRPRANGYFTDGERSGRWTFYDENANVITTVEYN